MPEQLNKAQQAYDAIESLITFRELAPGAAVSETFLMELTGLGRTPVREALQRLGRERMVEIHPHRGVFVAPMSFEEQIKLLEVRRAVEELAARWAAERANAAQRASMSRLADDLGGSHGTDVKAFGQLLRRAHELIVAAADNDYVMVAMAPLQSLSRRFWFAHLTDVHHDLAFASRLHADLLNAILSGGADHAATASLALNDYLTEFAWGTVRRAGAPRPVEPRAT